MKTYRIAAFAALSLVVLAATMLMPSEAFAAALHAAPAAKSVGLHDLLTGITLASAGVGAVPEEVKKSIDGLMGAFEEFKATNDKRIAEIEKKGSADVLVTEKLGRIEKTLDQFETINQKLTRLELETKASKEALEKAETKLARIPVGSGRKDDQNDETKAAFDGFLRRGKENMSQDEVKILRVSDDTAGGFLAPVDYVREITKAVVEQSPMRPLVRVRNTTLRSVQVPKRTGTFSAVWVSEVGQRNENQGLAYGLDEVPTHELTAEVYVSMQELEDAAFDIEAELNGEFAEQFGVAEGAVIVNGNGVGKPQGFLFGGSNVGSVKSGAATAITGDGVLSLYYGVKTAYAQNGTFVLNRKTIGSVRKLKDSNGQYIWTPGLANGVPNTINGAGYVEVPDMPDEAAGSFPIAFGDFRRAYTLVDRLVISILRDPYTRAGVGQVKFVARRRLGGQVTLAEAIQTLQCSA